MEGFKKSEKTLHLTVRCAVPENEPDLRFVVVLDQFEEIFTLCSHEQLRDALVRNLLYAAKSSQGQTLLVLTMRADFYGKCAANAELAAAISAITTITQPNSFISSIVYLFISAARSSLVVCQLVPSHISSCCFR
jgi:hypothetical protein